MMFSKPISGKVQAILFSLAVSVGTILLLDYYFGSLKYEIRYHLTGNSTTKIHDICLDLEKFVDRIEELQAQQKIRIVSSGKMNIVSKWYQCKVM